VSLNVFLVFVCGFQQIY